MYLVKFKRHSDIEVPDLCWKFSLFIGERVDFICYKEL